MPAEAAASLSFSPGLSWSAIPRTVVGPNHSRVVASSANTWRCAEAAAKSRNRAASANCVHFTCGAFRVSRFGNPVDISDAAACPFAISCAVIQLPGPSDTSMGTFRH